LVVLTTSQVSNSVITGSIEAVVWLWL